MASSIFSGSNVFKDESKLSLDYVPDELPGREDTLKRLGAMFRGVVDGKIAQFASIQGPVGSGKTAVARRFADLLHREMHGHQRDLRTAYVNCRNNRTDLMALTAVMKSIDKGFPDRGFAIEEMLAALAKRLQKLEVHLLVILDEADVLLRQESNLFYYFSRFESGTRTPALSVIAVSQTDIHKRLDEASASSFPATNRIKLEGYGHDPMRAITDQRIDLAFHKGTVSEDVAELVADMGAAKGDARRVIQVLHAAGNRANLEARDEVAAEDARVANEEIFGELPDFKLRELPLHELLVLLALARRLARSGEAFAITGDVEDVYQLVCEEFEENPRGHTQFWQYLRNLASYRFIDLKRSGKGQAGTTMLISLPDVSAVKFKGKLVEIVGEVHGKAV